MNTKIRSPLRTSYLPLTLNSSTYMGIFDQILLIFLIAIG